jgi:hypothetical protein
VRWETFYTFGEATSYGDSAALAALEAAATPQAACCAPAPKAEPASAGACCG